MNGTRACVNRHHQSYYPAKAGSAEDLLDRGSGRSTRSGLRTEPDEVITRRASNQTTLSAHSAPEDSSSPSHLDEHEPSESVPMISSLDDGRQRVQVQLHTNANGRGRGSSAAAAARDEPHPRRGQFVHNNGDVVASIEMDSYPKKRTPGLATAVARETRSTFV